MKFDPTAFLDKTPPAYETVVQIPLYSTYIIQNDKGAVYVGMTANLQKRLAQHRAGTCKTSAALGDWNFHVVHVYAGLNYMMSSKLERLFHKVQRDHGDSAVLSMVTNKPMWTGSLRDTAMMLSDTSMEVRAMKRDMSCGRCGREVCDCYDRDL